MLRTTIIFTRWTMVVKLMQTSFRKKWRKALKISMPLPRWKTSSEKACWKTLNSPFKNRPANTNQDQRISWTLTTSRTINIAWWSHRTWNRRSGWWEWTDSRSSQQYWLDVLPSGRLPSSHLVYILPLGCCSLPRRSSPSRDYTSAKLFYI